MNFLDDRLPPRFWSKVTPEPNSGCWLFFGATTSSGYGNFFWKGKIWGAHRVTYEALIGPIPDGLSLDHRVCQTPACCNPAHLEPVTHRVNMLRSKVNCIMVLRAKTACPKGHPYSHRHKNGARRCGVCIAEQAHVRWVAKHGVAADRRRVRDEQICREFATGEWTKASLGRRHNLVATQISNILRRAP